MSDNYQLRKDVDKLSNTVFDVKDESVRFVQFDDNTDLYITIGNVTRKQTIDEIISSFSLKINELEARIEELENDN